MRESVAALTPLFDYRESIITLNAIGSASLFQANANRAGFVVSNLTAGQPGYVSMIPNARGIFIPPQGSPVYLLVQDIGPCTRNEWFGTRTGGAPVDLYVLEILYRPDLDRSTFVPRESIFAPPDSGV